MTPSLTALLAPGTPSAVGSLPLVDCGEAAALALALQPELPAAPQLPRRSCLEGMLAQVSAGMPGVTVDGAGNLTVDPRTLAGTPAVPLHPEAWAGTIAFLGAAAGAGHAVPLKLQLTGPVTLGLALVAAGAPPARAFAAAGETVASRARALVEAAAGTVPGVPLVMVLDEPGLTAVRAAGFPLGSNATIDLLSGAMAAAAGSCRVGIHCCGPTDWGLVLHAGPDLVSLPVEAALGDDDAGFSSFLDRGGWIAWGAVPTHRPLDGRDAPHWRRLRELWGDLARSGCDPRRLRRQSIVTPACGLGLHQPDQVAPVYALVRRLAERVQGEAAAARLPA